MRVNADFGLRAVVRAGAELKWIPSPMPGVDRHMLDRIGSEVARATTVVKYAVGSKFREHVHGGGEEFLVLDGTFSDATGDYPAGCYIRNPPTSKHAPWADDGCVILVKLHQFDLKDRAHVVVDTTKMVPVEPKGREDGIGVIPLFNDGHEDVRIETWAPGTTVDLDVPKGGEFFVVDGDYQESGETLAKWDWLRLPPGGKLKAVAGVNGARLWVKTGHLADIDMARYDKF